MVDLKRQRPHPREARTRGRQSGALDAIAPVIFRTRASMLVERLARAFWPLGSLLLAGWSLAAFGVLDLLGRGVLLVALGGFVLGALFLAAGGLRGFRWPRRGEALARLDASLPGRPIAALLDIQAAGRDDPASVAVWAAHRARMGSLARLARAGRPEPRLSRCDPWALRLVAMTSFLAALLFAQSEALDPVRAALAPSGGAAVAAGPSYEAWATPPAYTGRPTLYLPEVPGDRPVPLPEGTEITLRLYGDAADFTLSESVSGTDNEGLSAAAEGIAAARFAMKRTGLVTLREREQTLGTWSFVLEPDAPPEIALTEPVSRATGGATSIAWSATDDYGVAAAQAEVMLDLARVDRRYGLATEPAARAPLAIDLPMPMTGGSAAVEDTLVEDFSKHPWAGLPVRVALTAEDAIGQQGSAAGTEAVLPSRRFYHPVAAALVEQRRDILWSRDNAARVTQVLRAVTHRPEDVFPDGRAYLLTRTAIRWLVQAREKGALEKERVEEIAETLWQAALVLEEGGLGDAAERLARAQERLQEALRSGASDQEVAELMDELREATRDYMQRLAEEAQERGETQQAENQNGQAMSPDQIQELMDRIQELSEQGRRAEAEQLLEMLRQMLENMEMRLTEGGSGQGQGGEAMESLAETLRDQQDLADESFQQLQREFRQNRMGQESGQGGGSGSGSGTSPEALAQRQEELREMLDALRKGMPGAQGEAGEAAREALRQAERNMSEARDRLQEGDTSGALDQQADAIEQLREGMRGLGEEMGQAGGQGTPGDGSEGGDAFSDRQADPLGRPLGARGSVDSGGTMVPDGDARSRARELLDEIRRRAGELSRPDVELDYLRRLLDRF